MNKIRNVLAMPFMALLLVTAVFNSTTAKADFLNCVSIVEDAMKCNANIERYKELVEEYNKLADQFNSLYEHCHCGSTEEPPKSFEIVGDVNKSIREAQLSYQTCQNRVHRVNHMSVWEGLTLCVPVVGGTSVKLACSEAVEEVENAIKKTKEAILYLTNALAQLKLECKDLGVTVHDDGSVSSGADFPSTLE